MRIQYHIPADEDVVYTDGCFDSSIGETMMIKIKNRQTQATIVKYEIISRGRSVLWTVDIPEAPEILANPN